MTAGSGQKATEGLLPSWQKPYTGARGDRGESMQDWGFWAVIAALAAAVAVSLLPALRRGGSPGTDDAALAVYRDQLAEIDRDLARAVIAPAEADRLRTEVSRRLLDADRALAASRPAVQPGQALLPLMLILLAVAGSLALYARLGAPGYPDLPLADRLAMAEAARKNRPGQEAAEARMPAAEASAAVDPEFLALMAKLRAAVAERPDDAEGLALLARNEAALGNMVAARQAGQKLLALKGDAATGEDHLALAETMILAAGGYVSPEAEAELIRTLELDPQAPLARYYSGLMFAQTGRPDRAFALWEALLREGPAEAPWIAAIAANLPALAEAAGIRYQAPAPAVIADGPSSEAMAAAADMSPEERQAMIAGMVDQRETRLLAEGGSAAEWAELVNALFVLGETDRARAAVAAANAAHAGDTAALATIAAAARAAGVAP